MYVSLVVGVRTAFRQVQAVARSITSALASCGLFDLSISRSSGQIHVAGNLPRNCMDGCGSIWQLHSPQSVEGQDLATLCAQDDTF